MFLPIIMDLEMNIKEIQIKMVDKMIKIKEMQLIAIITIKIKYISKETNKESQMNIRKIINNRIEEVTNLISMIKIFQAFLEKYQINHF